MRGFKRSADGYRAVIGIEERAVLAAVAMDVARLLSENDPTAGHEPAVEPDGSGWSGIVLPTLTDGAPPMDPAVRRLLPDASRSDPEVAAEFRRLTQDELRRSKHRRLLALARTFGARGDELVVLTDEVDDFLAACTDVRLVLGERLGIRTDADAAALDELLGGDADEDDPEDAGQVAGHDGAVGHDPGRDGADGDGADGDGADGDRADGDGSGRDDAGTWGMGSTAEPERPLGPSEAARRSLGLVHSVLGWTQGSLLQLVMADREPKAGGLRQG